MPVFCKRVDNLNVRYRIEGLRNVKENSPEVVLVLHDDRSLWTSSWVHVMPDGDGPYVGTEFPPGCM